MKKKMDNEKIAEFRISVVSNLLSQRFERGELCKEFEDLSKKKWIHPGSGKSITISIPTLERWYYALKNNPCGLKSVLNQKNRSDFGCQKSIPAEIKVFLQKEFKEHPSWSYQLHYDNVKSVYTDQAPSYSTLHRYMKRNGLVKVRNKKNAFTDKEKRGYECNVVNGLWHSDFHDASRTVALSDGTYATPQLLCVIDDYSRLVCHAQWFLTEQTEDLIHGFIQALLKRGTPRSILTDNGGAFISTEFKAGLRRLDIGINNTLPYHPEQNAKQERFFGTLEGRLMKMIENKKDLTLEELNRYTVVWTEKDYNHKTHDELKDTPANRFATGKNVGRSSKSFSDLKKVFCRDITRKQRRTDGTITIDTVRFEIPNRFRTLNELLIRYTPWDLSCAYIVDPKSTDIIEKILPENRNRNYFQGRRTLSKISSETPESTPKDDIAPLLKKYLQEFEDIYKQLPYIPKDETR